VHVPGYFPGWHPYFRAVRFRIQSEDKIGPQMTKLGMRPADVRQVLLTHLHTDHAGGLAHSEKSRIRVNRPDYEIARGRLGWLQGYLPRGIGRAGFSPSSSGSKINRWDHSHRVWR